MRTRFLSIPLSVALAPVLFGQNTPAFQDASLVQKALAAEASAAQDTNHPVRFWLRKSSPRLTTTKEMVETRDGTIAMLIAINDQPPSSAAAATEQARLDDLLANPGKQRHRKQSQDTDTARALKVLRALPKAFIFQYAGAVQTATGTAEKFNFTPNPHYDPPDLETQVLTALNGEIWIDPVHLRVVRLEAHLFQDVDFGWGILGRLSKGGWISINQAEVLPGVWKIVKFQMNMTGRLLIRTRTFITTEEESNFAPVPQGLSYQQGIALLRNNGAAGGR